MNMKKPLCFVLSLTSLVSLVSLTSCSDKDYDPNPEFEEYLDQFFLDYLEDDFLSWNILTVDPKAFGYERDETVEAKWYTYETLEENWKEEGYTELLGYQEEFLKFKNAKLSKNQRVSYRLLDSFFNSNLEYYKEDSILDPLARLQYIDQFGGYAADFGTYIEAYVLHSKQEIKDVLSYIKSLPEAFDSYITYGQDRITAGYPLSDYTLDEMISYLNNVTKQGEDYYLTDIINGKIDGCSFLTADEKTSYKTQVEEHMAEYFIPAYTDLATDLEGLKGKCTETGYLAAYGDVGKAQFEYDLKDLLGLPNLDLDQYEKYLLDTINEYSKKIDSVLNLASKDQKAYNTFVGYVNNGTSITGIKDPNEMITYLKEFATTIVPTLENTPEITVKYMDDASAEVSNAVAYYMKSPLDGGEVEYITLNGKQLAANYNDTISTMAHEGYPGHLYSYIYSKQLDISNIAKIMTSTAHAEGWATYVQLKLFEYMKEHNAQPKASQKAVGFYCDYSYYNQVLSYVVETYVDYMIHMKGYTANNIAALFNQLGFNADAAEEIYLTLIEMPTQYAAYGYGMIYFLDLHEQAKKAKGSKYNEVEFNAKLLSNGWCSLERAQELTDEYIKSK